MASSRKDLVRKLGAAATTIERGQTQAVTQVAVLSKEIMVASAGRSGLRPSSTLGGRKWSVGFNVRGGNRPTALVSYRGPVHWIERGTQPHVIGAKLLGTRGSIAYNAGTATASGSTRGSFGPFLTTTNSRNGPRARRGKRALSWGVGPKAWAFHPGTRARPFWKRARTEVARRAPDEMRRQLRSQLLRAGLGTGSATAPSRPSGPVRTPRNQWTSVSIPVD